MQYYSIKDVSSENFDFSVFKLYRKEIKEIFSLFKKRESFFNEKAIEDYNREVAEKESMGKIKYAVNVSHYLSPYCFCLNAVQHIVQNSFGLDHLGLCLLFDFDSRAIFSEEFSKIRTHRSKVVHYLDYFVRPKQEIEYFADNAIKHPSIKTIYGNYCDDLEDMFLLPLMKKSFNISYVRKIEITSKYLKNIITESTPDIKATISGMSSISSEIIPEFIYNLDINDLDCVYKKYPQHLSERFKIKYYKRKGVQNFLDEMIDDKQSSIRLLALKALDPKDERILKFTNEKDKAVFELALQKADIKFIPMFYSSDFIRRFDSCKVIFNKRIEFKT
jgi:hypothetical protein